jgi:phenylalanyl-tRNA synthetase beta chain
MNILTNWLRHYVPTIPVDDRQLADDLTLRGIAVEGVHSLGATVDGKSNGSLFEMDITTNRVDAMNHYGIAREGATIYNLPLSPLLAGEEQNAATKDVATKNAVILSEAKNPRISSEAPQSFPIRIEAKDLCGRFTAQILRDVTIAPSTGRVSEYFTLLNQKQISNAVDASNFVLLGMGHPTHAFDLDKLEGGIVVRLARKGEKLKLLDGTDRILEPDDLVVADENKALALAGVMGGYDSMITAETKNILVEAAWFDPAAIRRSSRRHGLHTDASHRFERGADFNACPTANALVSQLILESGGHAEGKLIDVVIPEIEAHTASRPPVTLSVKQVQRHLGTTLDDTPNHSALTPDLIHQYLTALGCTLTASRDTNPGAPSSRPPQGRLSLGLQPQGIRESEPSLSSQPEIFQVQLPSWRLDLEREIDLIEEVARVYGYNRFANTLPTAMPVVAHPLAAKEAAVRTRLLALGFSESISSTFASQQDAALFYTAAENPRVPTEAPGTATNPGAPSSRPFLAAKVGIRDSEPPSSNVATKTPGTIPLENPLSEEATLLRPSLVPGMLTMLAHNLNRDVKDVRLFEQGHIFTGTTHQVNETSQLSLGLTTAQPQATALHTAHDAPFFELKGAIESILSLFTHAAASAPTENRENSKEETSSRPEAAHLPPQWRESCISSLPLPALTFTPEAPQWLQPGRSATALLNDQPIAHFGELAHSQRDHRKLRQPIYLAQLDLAKLYELPLKKVTARDLSRFQAVERDFSFTFPDTMQWQTIAAAIHALAIPELQRLTPTEIFRDPKGKSVPPYHYALLLKCVFQSNDRTLREDELTTWWSTIIATLTQLGGTIRAPGNLA